MKEFIAFIIVFLMVSVGNSQSINNDYIFTIDNINCKMIFVSGGEYEMVGNFKGTDKLQIVPDFYIGETEVTLGLWSAIMSGTKPSYFKGYSNYPVEQVSWEDCNQLVDRLNVMNLAPLGYKFALPSSATVGICGKRR